MQSRKGIGGNIVKNDLFNDRISRFSIRKLNVGVCSVLLGTLVMLGTAANVSADEVAEDKQVEGVTATTEVESPANLPTVETEKTPETTYQADAAPVVPAEKTAPATTDKAEAPVTPTEKAPVVAPAAPAQADKKEEVTAASVEAPAKEETATPSPAENTGKRRSRRALGDANDPNLIADDVEDATSTPKVEKPGFTTGVDAKSLTSQISWLDLGDVANWTGAKTIQVAKNESKPNELTESLALQVGATYTKEIMPGYVVTIKVKSLKPFQATEIYKKRMEDQGATEAEKATYDPNAKNGYVKGVTSQIAKKNFNDGKEADIIADAQNRWTEIQQENVDTKAKKTTIGSAYNGGNIGVQFEISATFRGKKVKPAVVMADGESANPGEFVMFTTNGEG